MFLDSPGPNNTNSVINAVVKRVEEGDIDAVVIASVSGRTAVKVAERLKESGLRMKVVCINGEDDEEETNREFSASGYTEE